MGSGLFLFELLSEHEPENRKCPEIKETMLRFMESAHDCAIAHGADEPAQKLYVER
jgi:hypothetical protein